MDELQNTLFNALGAKVFAPYLHAGKVAVALSGGPDSMALSLALSRFAQNHGGLDIHALTVDHGLRAESWQEAEAVHQMMSHWPHLQHYILNWQGDKPSERVQEAARTARYDLIASHCKAHDIKAVFLAHHQGDQAETVLFRLAKGSGLDGLGGIRPVQQRGDIILLRPFLNVVKEDLIAYCHANNIAYFNDPSNEKEAFARVRLRKSREVLKAEGLSDKRLSVTAKRLMRAREALDAISEKAYESYAVRSDTSRIEFNCDLLGEPEEIVLRVVKMAMGALNQGDQGYGAREERVEGLVSAMIDDDFNKRTLGGVIFDKDTKRGVIVLTAEVK